MFIERLYRFLLGYFVIRVTGKKPERFINGLLLYNIKFRELFKISENEIEFKIPKRQYNESIFKEITQRSGNETFKATEKGIKTFFMRYKKRAGMYLGVLLGILLLNMSTFFIWNVNIVDKQGLNELEKKEMIEILAQLGCKVGALKRNIKSSDIQNAFLLHSQNISWIAVNLKGTVANIEFRKRDIVGEIIQKDKAANIIANKTGKVMYIDTYQGQQVITEGDTVQKGDLLISGIVDSDVVGMQIKHAMGKVTAQTDKVINITIPLVTDEKVFTGNKKVKNRYKVLGRSILASVDFSKNFDMYDKKEEEKNVTLFDAVILPILQNIEYFEEYTIKSKKITPESAKIIANNKLNDIIYREFADIQIVSKNIEYEVCDDKVILYCNLECLEDIATEVEFDTNTPEPTVNKSEIK